MNCIDMIYCKRIECVCDWIDKYGWVYEVKCVIVEVRLVDEEYYEESDSVMVWMWLFVERDVMLY